MVGHDGTVCHRDQQALSWGEALEQERSRIGAPRVHQAGLTARGQALPYLPVA